MKKRALILVLLFISISFLFADYISIYGVTSWSRIDSHNIVLYRGSTPVAIIEVRFGYIYSTSNISFVKDFIGPYDKIIIDGEVYDITNVKRLY